MPEEIVKSYNSFKMWGSWVGFVVGVLVVFMSFVYMYGQDPTLLQFMSRLNPVNLFSKLLLDSLPYNTAVGIAIPAVLIVFLSTPIVFALYGWGIHSLFRKLKSK